MLRKTAALAVLEAWQVPERASAGRLRKLAHRVTFDYTPRPGYLYVRSRAISSRSNDNHDEFPAGEIEASYRSFLGKPVFVNHHNANHRRARGVCVAVALHRDRNPDGSPDTWAETLMEIDARRFPKLCKAIIEGRVNRTSMGVDVERSVCSACGNQATDPAQYCRHLPALKGRKIRKRAADGKLHEEIIREICHGLSFFENSLLVEDPADPTAYILGKPDARGLQATAATRPLPPEEVLAQQPVDWEEDSLRSEARAGYQPGEHPWFQANPVSADNIVGAWHDTNDDERALGGRWYKEAHHVAKSMAGGDAAKGAGVLSAYSPRTSWPANLINASHALTHPDDPPGPGSGAMGMHQAPAKRILAGEHHSVVFSEGKNAKRKAFAHLIEHGGDTDEDIANGTEQVVIDRHALSTAIGRRITDDDATNAPLDQLGQYGHVADAYREAAHRISVHEGRRIAPHEVQAAVWLRQQRVNRVEDAGEAFGGKGRLSRERNASTKWHQLAHERHPEINPENMHHHPATDETHAHPDPGDAGPQTVGAGTREAAMRRRGRDHEHGEYHGAGPVRRLAYGETKVPPEIETLRQEECPVCGESQVWTGQRCPVCGYVAPPDLFRDPDTSKAKEVREELGGEGDVDLPAEGQGSWPAADLQMFHPDQIAPNGVPTGPAGVAEDGSQLPQLGDGDASLACPACGAQVPPDAAAEGDPCPECGQAPLEAGEPEEGGEGEPEIDPETGEPVEDGEQLPEGEEAEEEEGAAGLEDEEQEQGAEDEEAEELAELAGDEAGEEAEEETGNGNGKPRGRKSRRLAM